MTVDLDNPMPEDADWARLLEAATRERNQLRSDLTRVTAERDATTRTVTQLREMLERLNGCEVSVVVGGYAAERDAAIRERDELRAASGLINWAEDTRLSAKIAAERDQWRSMHGQELEMRMEAEKKLRRLEALEKAAKDWHSWYGSSDTRSVDLKLEALWYAIDRLSAEGGWTVSERKIRTGYWHIPLPDSTRGGQHVGSPRGILVYDEDLQMGVFSLSERSQIKNVAAANALLDQAKEAKPDGAEARSQHANYTVETDDQRKRYVCECGRLGSWERDYGNYRRITADAAIAWNHKVHAGMMNTRRPRELVPGLTAEEVEVLRIMRERMDPILPWGNPVGYEMRLHNRALAVLDRLIGAKP